MRTDAGMEVCIVLGTGFSCHPSIEVCIESGEARAKSRPSEQMRTVTDKRQGIPYSPDGLSRHRCQQREVRNCVIIQGVGLLHPQCGAIEPRCSAGSCPERIL